VTEENSVSDKTVMENILSNSDFCEGLHLGHANSCDAFVASEGSGYHNGVGPQSVELCCSY
jgi:hypothetical protein